MSVNTKLIAIIEDDYRIDFETNGFSVLVRVERENDFSLCDSWRYVSCEHDIHEALDSLRLLITKNLNNTHLYC